MDPPAPDLHRLLACAVEHQASDLHLSAGLPPLLRIHGDMQRLPGAALDDGQVRALVSQVMTDDQRQRFEHTLECDFAFELPGLARFRANVFKQRRGVAAALRTIPGRVLTLEDLGAPRVLADLALRPRGLILVTGPTGSGKSTTLAAMVHHLNESAHSHILTIEDPIEFVHASRRCLVSQREVGPCTHSFAAALRSALREDPDAILVGEMRDLETIRLALTAAETGHLVLATLHTSSAPKTIDRIIDVFPAGEKELVRAMLSESLLAVISQTLCKLRDGSGRVAAHEVLLGTPAIRNLIREGKVAQMTSVMQTSQAQGMQTLDQCLVDLVRRGRIAPAEARRVARAPESLPVA
jgi:twitching motility protein PilT